MKNNLKLFCALATLTSVEVSALTVTIDCASPAAEKDFAYHIEKMGAAKNVALKTAPHQWSVKSDMPEAFRLKIENGRAWISGKTAQGVSHGLYELLERMGCDWVLPGAVGEVIPACTNPAPADCDIEEIPSFRVRCPWYPGNTKSIPQTLRDEHDVWKTRKKLHANRYAGHPLVMHGGHEWGRIISRNRKEFAANPEMYALVRLPDGTYVRRGPQLETTHPRVLELFEKYIRDEFRRKKWPKDKTVCLSVGPSDGGGFSQSLETRMASSGRRVPISGSIDGTDVMVLLCNTLIKRLEKEFPNLHLGFYLYSWHADFPVKYKPDPKVVIVIADISYSRMHSTFDPVPTRRYYRSIMEKWANTDNVKFFRGYNWNLAENFLPYSKIKMWEDDLRLYHKMNVQGVYNESMMAWSTLGPSNYLEAEMLWNVNVDTASVLEKYCKAAFGDGAPYLQEYYTRITRRQNEALVEAGGFHGFHMIYDKAFVESAKTLFDQAAATAVLDVEKERIANMRLPLDHLGVFLDLREHQFAFRFGEAKKLLDRMIAERLAARAKIGQQWVTGGAVSMLKRFFEESINESHRYSSAPYRLVYGLPDTLVTVFDPYNSGSSMGFAEAAVNDANWLKTKTYSMPWSAQGLSSVSTGSVWYRVKLPEMPDEPLGLMIGGCNSLARIYVNGEYVGEGRGFAKPMAFDLTGFIKPGKGNFLAIQVQRSGGGDIGVGGMIYPSFIFAGPRLKERAPKFDESIRYLPGGAIERVKNH
jgi:hypothetical protein